MVICSNMYRWTKGVAMVGIQSLLFSVLVTVYLSTWMNRENKRRDCLLNEGEKIKPSIPEQQQRLGDRDLHYRYVG